ncbi:MAG: hypothetical protein KC620_06845 [Myxococcales bacterium]|nr:hypothetical protein [Myxococcales bacterium]
MDIMSPLRGADDVAAHLPCPSATGTGPRSPGHPPVQARSQKNQPREIASFCPRPAALIPPQPNAFVTPAIDSIGAPEVCHSSENIIDFSGLTNKEGVA